MKKNFQLSRINVCGNFFRYIKKHIKSIHERQRNYKCDYCGKYLNESGSLKNHIKTVHDGQRSYKCGSCGKLFSESGSL